MTAPVFIAETAILETAIAGTLVALGGPEGRHAAVVRRIETGEQIELVDGRGRACLAVVRTVGKQDLTAEVLSMRAVPPPALRLVVVQALPKGDRGELAVELMTEAGVDEVVPWAAQRCVTQWRDERGDKALTRWRATAREASKQSRRAWHPVVSPLASTRDVAERLAAASLGAVLHEEAETPWSELTMPTTGEVVLVVGPEGGIGADELRALGAPDVRLGVEVVRTSSAGAFAAVAASVSSHRWQA